ncbi:MAG: M20/M25/M40 family metallo-hydrolase, partial [Acidobacteriia bacterium]|nr:M20/M25/M40 family metallo-hydrolase [Terriglobia bacterium]
MDQFLRYAKQKQKEIIALTRELVECESPSDDPASVARLVQLMTQRTKDIATVNVSRGTTYGPNARFTFTLPGEKKDGQILVLGHSDTVWPMGTLAKMPFRESKGRLWGPGVLDMKAGMVFFIFAMRALRDLEVPVRRRVVLQVNADEEVGSDSSRAWTEEAA